MSKVRVNFITVVNNWQMYDKLIKENLFIKDRSDITTNVYNNVEENKFISVRYNEFLNSFDYSEESWLIFCHNDWELLEDIMPILFELDKGCIYGPSGSKLYKEGDKYTGHLIGICSEKTKTGEGFRKISIVEDNMEVDTLDCQCVIVHSSLVEQYSLRFDENLEWDLYVEDFCINAKEKYNIIINAIVFDCCHWSNVFKDGVPNSYYKTLEYINKKYQNSVYSGTNSLIGGGKIKLMSVKEAAFYRLRKGLNGKKYAK